MCSYAICIPTHRKEKYILPNSHTKRKVVLTEADGDGREKESAVDTTHMHTTMCADDSVYSWRASL